MRIVVADQRVEDDIVEQLQDLRRMRAGDTAQQGKTLRQIRPAFVLVFQFRHDAQRLAKIFLMQALSLAAGAGEPVVAFNQQE